MQRWQRRRPVATPVMAWWRFPPLQPSSLIGLGLRWGIVAAGEPRDLSRQSPPPFYRLRDGGPPASSWAGPPIRARGQGTSWPLGQLVEINSNTAYWPALGTPIGSAEQCGLSCVTYGRNSVSRCGQAPRMGVAPCTATGRCRGLAHLSATGDGSPEWERAGRHLRGRVTRGWRGAARFGGIGDSIWKKSR